MNHVFIQILNNSLIASLLILAVMIVRLMIKRAPKWFSCVLWGFVAIKLVLPFNIESVFSLVPSSEPIPRDIEYSAAPHIDSGVEVINQVVNPVIEKNFTPQEVVSVNPLQIVIMVCSVLWIAGMIALLMYSFLSYLLLKKKVLDLFTAAEEYEAMEKGEIEESDPRTMKHWVAFYTKGEGEPLYM